MLSVSAGFAALAAAAAAARCPGSPTPVQMGARILFLCTQECKWSRYREIQGLLLAGASINVCDANGFVALMHAARRGHVEYVELLLSFGAIADYAATAMAIEEGQVHVVRVLLRFCSDRMFVEDKLWQSIVKISETKSYLVSTLLQNHRKSLSLHMCMLTSLCRNTCLRQLRYLKPQDSRDPPCLTVIYPYDSLSSRSQLILLDDGQPHPYRQMSTPSLMSSPCDFASHPQRRNKILRSSSLLRLLAYRLVVPLFAENSVDRGIWGMTRDIVLHGCSSAAAKAFAIASSCLILVPRTRLSCFDTETLRNAADMLCSSGPHQWEHWNEDAWRLLHFDQIKIENHGTENSLGVAHAHSPLNTCTSLHHRSRSDWEALFDLNEASCDEELQQVKKELRLSIALDDN